MERRPISALLVLLLTLASCRGAVTARGMKALGRWSDREIAVEGARPGEPEEVAWARVGALEGLERAGLAFTKEPGPGALVVRVREVGAREGKDTLLSSPGKFATAVGMEVAGQAGKAAAQAETGAVRGAGKIVGTGLAIAGGVAAVRESSRVRIALELFAPDRDAPLGGVVWEGFENLSRKGAAEKAGSEGGEALAHEIASQRDRWLDRRPSSERLFRTPTPLLLEPGEAVVSLDQGLLLHAGYGVKRWLQLDAAAGGWLVPSAGGIVHSRWDGTALMGAASIGVKVRLAEEGPLRPGISASFDRLTLWSGSIGSGRIAIFDHVVDTSSPDASSGVSFNLLTLALSKHPREWLQIGAGGVFVDYHALTGSGARLVEEEGTRTTDNFLRLLPYLNVEARAGEHFRFIGEFTYPGGFTIGVRTLLFGSRRFGELRTSGWRVRLDTAVVLTSRDTDGGAEPAVLPWLGVAFYPR